MRPRRSPAVAATFPPSSAPAVTNDTGVLQLPPLLPGLTAPVRRCTMNGFAQPSSTAGKRVARDARVNNNNVSCSPPINRPGRPGGYHATRAQRTRRVALLVAFVIVALVAAVVVGVVHARAYTLHDQRSRRTLGPCGTLLRE